MKNKVMDIYRPKNETLNDAFDRLVVKIHHQNRMYGHKTFVLTGCEPMVGTTTIAINVAISLAVSGLKTILIDGDLRKDGKYKRLNDSLEMGLSDVLAGNLDLASAICATNYVTLDYLPSGIKDENPVGLLYSPNLNEVISSLSEYYDYVIFDLPSANAAIDSNIFASKCDAVVLVAKQYSTNVMQIRNAKQELEKIAANLVGIVFNNVDSVEYRRYMKNYDYFNKNKFLVTKKKKKGKKEKERVSSSKKKNSKKGAEKSAFDLDYEKYVDENDQDSTYLKNESKPDIYDDNVAEAILEEETSEEQILEENVSEVTDEELSDENRSDDEVEDKEQDNETENSAIDMSDVIDEVRDDVIEAELDSVVGADSRDNEFQEITDEEFSSEEDYADEVYRENFAMKADSSEDVYQGVYEQTEYNNGYVSSEVMDNANISYDNSYISNGAYVNDYSVETSEIASMIGGDYAQSSYVSQDGYGEIVQDGNMNYEHPVNQYNTYSEDDYHQEQHIYNQESYDTEYVSEEVHEDYMKKPEVTEEHEVIEEDKDVEEVSNESINESEDIEEQELIEIDEDDAKEKSTNVLEDEEEKQELTESEEDKNDAKEKSTNELESEEEQELTETDEEDTKEESGSESEDVDFIIDEKNMEYSDMDKGLDDVVDEIEKEVGQQIDKERLEKDEEN